MELLFSRATATWVKDRLWNRSQQLTRLKDGRLRMTLEVANTPELVGWLLHFGGGVRVVGPEELRQRIEEGARKILRRADG